MTPASRAREVLLAGVVGLAGVGFLVGTSAPPGREPTVATASAPEAPMPSYRGQRTRERASSWPQDRAALLAAAPDGAYGAGEAVAAARGRNRAYDGAPPTVPHPIGQGGAAECLACHDEGLPVRGKVAPPMPHPSYASCTQCHVVQEAPMPGAALPPDASFGPNSFVGVPAPGKGARAWEGAPPEIPHRTTMRERCVACHGPLGREPMLSSHPERQSCTQCHAVSAAFDQAPTAGTGASP